MSRVAAWRSRQRARHGRAIFDRTLADYQNGRLGRARGGQLAATLLATGILLTSPLMILAGAALLWTGWPAILAIVLGGILIATGLFLWPRRVALPLVYETRDTMPETFALLDRISAHLDAPRVDLLVIDAEFNAGISEVRGRRVLQFGAVLWEGLSRDERVAVLAHEVGHLVNGDPLRASFVGRARRVLERWHYLLAPDGTSEVIAEIIQVPLTFAIEMLDILVLRLTFIESQRSEYLADALSAEAAGCGAAIAALRTVALGELATDRVNWHYGAGTPDGAALIRDVAAQVRSPEPERREALLAKMGAEEHAIDQTHPATVHRIEFLKALSDQPDADGISADWAAIEAEWEGRVEAAGRDLRATIVVQ